jgi:hypothetical protein
MAVDYEAGEVSDREQLAADRQKELARYSDFGYTEVADYNKGSANALADWNKNQQNQLAKQNAARTRDVARENTRATVNQLNRQLGNYDFANRQNANLRDTQFTQASRKSEAERFEAQRNLQNAAMGLFGTMGQAMNGSTVGNSMRMLEDRNDAENSTYWQQLQDNRNAIQNAYDESYNQNQVAKRDAAVNAIKALQDIQSDLTSNLGNIQGDLDANLVNIRGDLMSNLSNLESDLYANRKNLRADTAANLNNINPNLYQGPWGIDTLSDRNILDKNNNPTLSASGYKIPNGSQNPVFNGTGSNVINTSPGNQIAANIRNIEALLGKINEHPSRLQNYIMPANAAVSAQNRRNTLRGGDYFSRMMNRNNGV